MSSHRRRSSAGPFHRIGPVLTWSESVREIDGLELEECLSTIDVYDLIGETARKLEVQIQSCAVAMDDHQLRRNDGRGFI
jgi:hypothetical protein